MKNLINKFIEELNEIPLFKKKSKGLIAVSGGVDSVVLLKLFSKIKYKYKIEIGIVHLNHSYRKHQSDLDEIFVKDLAKKTGYNFFSTKWKSSSESNWEELARKARYKYFLEIINQENYNWLATAHHLNDQVETLLMRFIQGTSYRGLNGIPKSQNFLIRPLINISKNEILEYANKYKLKFKNDLTNQNTKFLRNRLRKNIIPLISEINPNFLNSINSMKNNFNEISNWIDLNIKNFNVTHSKVDRYGYIHIDIKFLKKYPMFIQQEIIKSFFSKSINWRKHIWSQLKTFLLSSKTGENLILDNSTNILKDRNKIILSKKKKIIPDIVFSFNSKHSISKEIGFNIFNYNKKIFKSSFTTCEDKEFIDFDLIKNKSLILRPWKKGDKMIPLGMKNYKKISDILIDSKINNFEKKNKYLLTLENKVIWLCGMKLDDRFKITSKTKSLSEIKWQNNFND